MENNLRLADITRPNSPDMPPKRTKRVRVVQIEVNEFGRAFTLITINMGFEAKSFPGIAVYTQSIQLEAKVS